MKNLSRGVLVCLLVLGAQIRNAKSQTIIYADTFTGTGDLSGAAPTIDNGGDGGMAGATWSTPTGIFTENGGSVSTPDKNTSTSAMLPFTPELGRVYTLTLTIVSDANFGMVGFDESATGVTNQFWYQDDTHDGVDWAIDGGNGDQEFSGPGTNGNKYAGTGNGEFILTLDTTQTNWSYSILVPGTTTPVTGTYTTNPVIDGVGLGMLFGAGVTYTGFSLTSVPEPATWAMLGTGLLGLLAWARRRAVV